MTETRVCERDFERFSRGPTRKLSLRGIEPTEHDGQRVRYFVERTG
jgi:hypothetical protein